MFKNVIVKRPSKSIVKGITSAPELGKPNYELALKQHDNYIEALKSCGVQVTTLDSDERFPDSCFIEDTAVVTKNCAIICNPGAESRNKEIEAVKKVMKQFFEEDKIEYITYPGTIEGGDVMMVGNHFYIGKSLRTNEEGARQFIQKLEKHGHTGSIVTLEEVLHLKTGLAYLENNNLLVVGEFIEKEEFKGEHIKLLTVARLHPEKGVDRIVNVSKKLLDEGKNFKWYVIGYGIEEQEIRIRAKELGVDNVIHFLGKKVKLRVS